MTIRTDIIQIRSSHPREKCTISTFDINLVEPQVLDPLPPQGGGGGGGLMQTPVKAVRYQLETKDKILSLGDEYMQWYTSLQ